MQWRHSLGPQHHVTSLQSFGSGAVLAGDSSGRILLSRDQGRSWELLAALDDAGGNSALALLDAEHKLLIGTECAGLFSASLRRSSPRSLGTGLVSEVIQSIAISPNFADDRLVLASTWRGGVFRSVDGGKTWRAAKRGLTTDHQADSGLFHSPHFREVRFVPGGPAGPRAYVAGFDGLFRSDDGGRSWTEVETIAHSAILDFAVADGPRGTPEVVLGTVGTGVAVSHGHLQAHDWQIGTLGSTIHESGMSWCRQTMRLIISYLLLATRATTCFAPKTVA